MEVPRSLQKPRCDFIQLAVGVVADVKTGLGSIRRRYVVRRGDESEVAEAKCSGVDGLLQLYELRRIIR